MNIPIQLSANFGELRSNHFHMGLDMRTMGKENLPLYAPADGYISRAKIGQNGFGRAIYISHPNGYTTLYAHLNRFYDALENFIHQKQYDDESWEQDVTFTSTMFLVQKGQFIAYTGSTGASEAPHLHFEIRDTKTDKNINPLLFGFDITDKIPPVIYGLYWYDRRYSTYQSNPATIVLSGKKGEYTSGSNTVKVSSPLISLGIRAEDKSSNSPFLFGIYRAELWLDDSLINAFTLNNISYKDTRYSNACIDYSKWKTSGIYIQHLSFLPGNFLSIFDNVGSNGVIILTDTLPHNINIAVSDAYGNTSNVNVKMQFDGSLQLPYSYPQNAKMLLPDQENNVTGNNVEIRFSKFAFYDVVPFLWYEQNNFGINKASAFITLYNPTVPVHDNFSISIKTTFALNDTLRERTVMQLVSGNTKSTVKGDWKGDWMTARFNRFGTVQLLIDTVPPVIQISGWKDGQKFSAATKTLRLLCKDDVDDVTDFRAELDGKWLLFEQKGNIFTYRFDEHCMAGNHQLNVMVKDIAGNTTQKTFSFVK